MGFGLLVTSLWHPEEARELYKFVKDHTHKAAAALADATSIDETAYTFLSFPYRVARESSYSVLSASVTPSETTENFIAGVTVASIQTPVIVVNAAKETGDDLYNLWFGDIEEARKKAE